MKSSNRSNALLVELLIVVLFFMLAATVLLQVFSTARNMSARSGWITQALDQAQNVAERLYAADAPEAELTHMGFDLRDGAWVLSGENWETQVTLSTESLPAGIMTRQEVRVVKDGEPLLSLPGTRYREVRP